MKRSRFRGVTLHELAKSVLVLDDDEALAQLVADSLASAGLKATTAFAPAEALDFARKQQFDLVISDVNLPQMHGFAFRHSLRRMKGYADTPFLFISGADEQVESEIARSLGTDRILLKPFRPADLKRQALALLEEVRSERGLIADMLGPILERASAAKETGIIAAVSPRITKRVVLQGGVVVFAASNDPRDLIGQALLRAGWIKEKDLQQAFTVTGKTHAGGKPMLASVLTAMRKVTPEECAQVFESKVRESVLELFLWTEGVVEYVEGGIEEAEKPFPLSLDTASLLVEGLRRREKWKQVREILPDPSVRFERGAPSWPAWFPKETGEKILAKHIEAGLTQAEINVELRGQDYAVGVKLASLVKSGVLTATRAAGFSRKDAVSPFMVEDDLNTVGTRTVSVLVREEPDDVPKTNARLVDPDIERQMLKALAPKPAAPKPAAAEAPPVDIRVALVMTGLDRFRRGDYADARDRFASALALDPTDALARQRLLECDEALAKQAREWGLTDETWVSLNVPLTQLEGMDVSPQDAFVLARLSGGGMSVADIALICPMSEPEVLSVLQRYLGQNVLRRHT